VVVPAQREDKQRVSVYTPKAKRSLKAAIRGPYYEPYVLLPWIVGREVDLVSVLDAWACTCITHG
jgi:hypothetical protein